jgi:hypothetical protein
MGVACHLQPLQEGSVMKFCVQCGQQLTPEARFCVSCGTKAASGDTTTAASAAGTAGAPVQAEAQRQPEYAGVGAAHQDGHGQGHSPAGSVPETGAAPAAAPKKSNGAFAGIPVSDYIRDGIAALALILSLFMVWIVDDASAFSYGSYEESRAGTRIDVILITLVSLLSLGISYIWRAGVFGPSVGYRKIQDLKLLANIPYFILVLVYVALHLITSKTFEPSTFGTLGPALAFGLAGAVLAAQPRCGEIAPGDVDQPRNQRWIYVSLGIAGLATVVALVQIIRYWVAMGDTGFPDITGWGLAATLTALASAAVLVFIALQLNKRSDRWRRAGVILAFGSAFLSLIALFEDQTLLNLSLNSISPGFSVVFWMAFGAAVSAPSVARLTEASAVAPTDARSGLQPWLLLAAGLSGVLTHTAAIGLITKATSDYSDGYVPQVLALFFGLLLTAGAVVTMRLMGKDPRSAYIIPTGYAGLLFVLGLVLMIVWAVQHEGYLGAIILLLTFVVPAAILSVLWLPRASREHFTSLPGGNGSGTSGFTFAGAPAAQPTAQTPVQQTPAQAAGQGQTQQAPQAQSGRPVQMKEQPVQPAKAESKSQSETKAQDEAKAQPEMKAESTETETPAAAAKPETPAAAAKPETPAAAQKPSPGAGSTAGSTAAQPATGGGSDLMKEAANPQTPLARLQELAANHPETRPAVAANPSTYPALLTWLGQLGDPAVDQALRLRS